MALYRSSWFLTDPAVVTDAACLKAIRNGAIAGAITAVATAAMALFALHENDPDLSALVPSDRYVVIDVVVAIICSVVLYWKRSRVAACILLSYFIVSKVIHWWWILRPFTVLFTLCWFVLYLRAARAAFIWQSRYATPSGTEETRAAPVRSTPIVAPAPQVARESADPDPELGRHQIRRGRPYVPPALTGAFIFAAAAFLAAALFPPFSSTPRSGPGASIGHAFLFAPARAYKRAIAQHEKVCADYEAAKNAASEERPVRGQGDSEVFTYDEYRDLGTELSRQDCSRAYARKERLRVWATARVDVPQWIAQCLLVTLAGAAAIFGASRLSRAKCCAKCGATNAVESTSCWRCGVEHLNSAAGKPVVDEAVVTRPVAHLNSSAPMTLAGILVLGHLVLPLFDPNIASLYAVGRVVLNWLSVMAIVSIIATMILAVIWLTRYLSWRRPEWRWAIAWSSVAAFGLYYAYVAFSFVIGGNDA